MMLKEIELKDIVKMQNLYIEIFYEEDEDYPDRRVITKKEKAVQRILDKITDQKGEQLAIWSAIQRESWNMEDKTFKPICDKLRELGYVVKQREKRNEKIFIYNFCYFNDTYIFNIAFFRMVSKWFRRTYDRYYRTYCRRNRRID